MDQEEAKQKKNTWWDKIVGIVFFVVAYSLVRTFMNGGVSDPSLEQALVTASQQINKNTPMTLDQYTEMTTTLASGKQLIYMYRYLGDGQVSQADLNNYLKSGIVTGVCTTPETKKLVDMGAGLVYRYYNTDNRLIGEIPVDSSNCVE